MNGVNRDTDKSDGSKVLFETEINNDVLTYSKKDGYVAPKFKTTADELVKRE